MGWIVHGIAFVFVLLGAYSWFALGELNTFQKICYVIGSILSLSSFFVSGPFSLLGASFGSLFICISCYNEMREYWSR